MKRKKKTQTPQPLIEGYDGDCIGSNAWFKIGLTPPERELVKELAADVKAESSPSAAAARCLILFGLMRLDDVRRWLAEMRERYGNQRWMFLSAEIGKCIAEQADLVDTTPIRPPGGQHASAAPVPQAMPASPSASVVLEQRLQRIAAHLSARDQRVLAADFERWVEQLRLSADLIEGKAASGNARN